MKRQQAATDRAATQSRWEQGSEYHWLDPSGNARLLAPAWDHDARFYASGRDALRALLEHGSEHLGWTRLFVPSYMCQHVVRSMARTGIGLISYEDDPRWSTARVEHLPLDARSALLLVNHFGIRSMPTHVPSGGVVIEDHTHDPWSGWALASTSDYAVASLRKTLPIADGGVLWSPREHTLPASPTRTPESESSSAHRLAAALLKRRYLDGEAVDKAWFRELAQRGEALTDAARAAAMTPLSRDAWQGYATSAWRTARREGWSVLRNALGALPDAEVLEPPDVPGIVPYAVVLHVDDPARRDRLQQYLVKQRIYPAVLWPIVDDPELPSLPTSAIDLSRRILVLHCDGRYDREDLEHVARVVRRGLES